MNYKVGDKVVVREWEAMARGKPIVNDDIELSFGNKYFLLIMRQFCGKVAAITKIFGDDYRLDIDKETYCFTDEMLRPYFFYGERIEVRDSEDAKWEEHIFVGFIDGSDSPFNVVDRGEEQRFFIGKPMDFISFRYARAIEIPTPFAIQDAIKTLEKAGKLKDGKVVL